jgi:hypothetical protein
MDKQGQVMAVSNVQKVAPSPNRHLSHKLIGAFQGLIFPEEGSYQLMLSIDGDDIAGMAFQVLSYAPEVVA